MKGFSSVVLYVRDIAASKRFYTSLFGVAPEEPSPTFASYALESGPRVELKEAGSSIPAASATGGGTELCANAPDADSLKRLYAEWKGRGVAFALEPTAMVFGLSFVALDPDGHRIRMTAGN